MMQTRIRLETAADIPKISSLVQDVMGEDVARFVERLRNSDGYLRQLAFVAEDRDAIVGFVMLTYVDFKSTTRAKLLCLTPLVVAASHQRQGIGKRLVRAGLYAAENLDEPLVLVEGVPEYYPHFGFESASSAGLVPPNTDIPTAAWMVKKLRAYEPSIKGQVIYPHP